MRTLLFDIDGTLLLTNGGGYRAIKLAIEQEFAIEVAKTNIDFSGRTDRSLLVELLEENGCPTGPVHQERLRDRYASLLPSTLDQYGGQLLPGAVDLLSRIQRERGLRCYAMTGNLHETATRKLEFFGLLKYFRGIFGGDHDHDRDELAKRTAESLRRRYGDHADGDIVVVGDTPADIRCGRAIGAEVIAVCTGNFDRAQLAAEDPDGLHDDLSDVTTILNTLRGCDRQASEPRAGQ